MIGRDPDMRRAAVDHSENGADNAPDGCDLPSVRITGGRERIEMTEQFVSSVDEVDLQDYFFSLTPRAWSFAITFCPAFCVPGDLSIS